MGVGSIPDSPPTPAMPAGETAEDRERSYMQMDQEKNRHSRPEQSAAQPQQQPQTQYNSSVFPSYNTVPAPAAAFNTPGLYPQPIAGMPIRGMSLGSPAIFALSHMYKPLQGILSIIRRTFSILA